MIITSLTGNLEAPLSLDIGENYQLNAMKSNSINVSGFYKGQPFTEASMEPRSYYFSLQNEDMPFYLAVLPSIVIGLIVLLFIHLLVKLLRSIEERDFFSQANVKRLRYIGLIMMISEVLGWAHRQLLIMFLENNLIIEGLTRSGGFSFSLDLLFSYFFLGLMILLIANAFEHGLNLKKEQDLTI
ncbi:DUF2975 domain-containing protein [Roseivirga sp.]|uniref:DUF2975 domain-containing protein n=1 Tax=Roseivirga sp. TaxID=1964215 RepID=UPI003BAD68D5